MGGELVGVGYFIFGSAGAAFAFSCLVHAFLPQTRIKVMLGAASLPVLASLFIDPMLLSLHAIVFGVSLIGSAIGAAAAYLLRTMQHRLRW
ncbi:hypothetical protein VF14_35375 [Nostoc linckia z18]|nr:hypothetical protein VF14_35375 [Nostoc linckia z18]